MQKVIVGMSGGIDSSMTAYFLKQEGYNVEAVTFVLYEEKKNKSLNYELPISASKIAEYLGIKHITIDLKDVFNAKIIQPFISDYTNGLTPNPCVCCNQYIKFFHLLQLREERKADIIATGHYARIENEALYSSFRNHHSGISNNFFLKKGMDLKKEQSYFLYRLNRRYLEKIRFPLGDKRKEDIRRLAVDLGMPFSNTKESQEICFIQGQRYSEFFKDIVKYEDGNIIDIQTQKILGRHCGIHLYTLGQRKGLPVTGNPLYVVKIEPLGNNIYVSSKKKYVENKEFIVKDLNWLVEPNLFVDNKTSFKANVKIRSTMKEKSAEIFILTDNRAEVIFDEPQWAPAPGQSAVFYKESVILGGGIIERISSF